MEAIWNQLIDTLLHLDKEHVARLFELLGGWQYLLLFLIIFCETGLVVTPILPGDSLLFLVGALSPAEKLPLLLGLLIVAAVLGDAVNYAIGYRLGPKVFKYEHSRLFNKKHLLRAQAFYEKYGGKTIFLARFIPIIRTFAPFVAGIGKMQYRRFAIYNVAGGAAWVLGCTLSGYFLSEVELINKHFELIIVAIVLLSVLPMVLEYFLVRQRAGGSDQRPEKRGRKSGVEGERLEVRG
jgi:membrane-associated protein